jgi:hypothetical protein
MKLNHTTKGIGYFTIDGADRAKLTVITDLVTRERVQYFRPESHDEREEYRRMVESLVDGFTLGSCDHRGHYTARAKVTEGYFTAVPEGRSEVTIEGYINLDSKHRASLHLVDDSPGVVAFIDVMNHKPRVIDDLVNIAGSQSNPGLCGLEVLETGSRERDWDWYGIANVTRLSHLQELYVTAGKALEQGLVLSELGTNSEREVAGYERARELIAGLALSQQVNVADLTLLRQDMLTHSNIATRRSSATLYVEALDVLSRRI